MDADEIRSAFLDHLAGRGHAVIPRASLVPDDDPTTLFTGSGMQPLLPYLLGDDHPAGRRLVDSQTCLRVQDIEEVGDNRHTTFFEMLGSWSLGDYFKDEQLRQFWDFLTGTVGLDPARLYVSCFIGDEAHGIPKDDESAALWRELFTAAGVSADQVELGTEEHAARVGTGGARIAFYGNKNWWCREGTPGADAGRRTGRPGHRGLLPLPPRRARPGLRRALPPELRLRPVHRARQLRLHGVPPHRDRLRAAATPQRRLRRRARAHRRRSARHLRRLPDQPAVADHRAAPGAVGPHLRGRDARHAGHRRPPARGDVPRRRRRAPEQQGAGLRHAPARAPGRPLRRRPRHRGQLLPARHPDGRRHLLRAPTPRWQPRPTRWPTLLAREEHVFRRTLRRGLERLEGHRATGVTGADLFVLYDTYGFPVELSTEVARTEGIVVSGTWREEFDEHMAAQRARSRGVAPGRA